MTALFLFFVPFTNTLLSLSAVHFVIGLALGFVFPLLLDEVVRSSPGYLKMSAMGFFQSFYALGILFGPLVAGVIAENVGLAEVFYFTGLLGLLAVIVVKFGFRKIKMM